MRITILAIGTRGDVQPCLALGLGLRSAGHDVRVSAFSDFEQLVSQAGLPFLPISGSMRDLIQSEAAREIARSGGNVVKAVRLMAEILESLTEKLCQDLLNACRGSDFVIYSSAAPHGYHLYAIPEALGIPCMAAYLFPMFGYSRSFPHPLWPFDLHAMGAGSWLSNVATQQLIWQPFRKIINNWRRNVLGLRPVPLFGPYNSLQERPILYGYSPSLIPPPSVPWAYVTGFWFLDQPSAWTAPPALLDFIHSGSAPVYIGFGSVNSDEAKRVTDISIAAAAKAGQRAIVLTDDHHAGRASAEVFTVGSVPFDWLFPHVAAVVHHGGAGTTASVLRAGVPSVVVPFKGEQHFFGRIVKKVGAASASIPQKRLTEEALAAAIQTAVADPQIRARSAELGRRIRAEDGVGQAVRVFHHVARSVIRKDPNG